MLPGEKLPIVPVPVSETVCGLPLALSVTEIVPVTVPFATGRKVTEMLQLVPATMVAEQVLVWAKPALILIPERVRLAFPLLVRVTVCGGLVVLLSCVPKVKLVGEKVTAGAAAWAARLQRRTTLNPCQTRFRPLKEKYERKVPDRGRNIPGI